MHNLNKNMKKTILITGASSKIGKVVGEYLTNKGHQVIGTSRNPDKKLAVQWLNEVQFFNQTFVQVESFVL